MPRMIVIAVVCALALLAGENGPVVRAWLLNPAAKTTSNDGLRAVLPNVHAVGVDERYVTVESAGLSLQSLGELEANDGPPAPGARKLLFRIPVHARPAEGGSPAVPVGPVGVFLNGVPFYSPVSTLSYRDQNLWHLDAIAMAKRNAAAQAPLVASLMTDTGRHSPLIGFALDGYPVYGPYAWDGSGKPRRMRSSYQLRRMTRRTMLPDGTQLTPAQEGPAVDAEFPLGIFAEDYEFAAGSGDLDEHNGRFSKTPEYPEGTYAYYLSTYPYLVGPTYAGALDRPACDDRQEFSRDGDRLTFTFHDARGRKVRYLEKAHEQPVHLLVVSSDLAEFAHIHPELQDDGTYSVNYSFRHGGTYWLYADHTLPGESQKVSRFRVDVGGAPRQPVALRADTNLTKTVDGLTVKLTTSAQLRAGEDLHFRFDLSANDLQPYLGAWAHIMIVSQDREEFIHGHPLENTASAAAPANPWAHTHAAPGPSPSYVETITGFRKPGLYRLWAQFQRDGRVITIPYTVRVEPAVRKQVVAAKIPSGARLIRVSSTGFEPTRVTLPAGKPAILAFQRSDAQNCASSVVFPELDIRKPLPAGETVTVDIPASKAREVYFTCGMGMYRGALSIR